MGTDSEYEEEDEEEELKQSAALFLDTLTLHRRQH